MIQIAAVLIVMHFAKDQHMPELVPTSPLTKIVRTFIISLETKVDVFKEYGVNHFADILIISTGQDYRGQGLATEMYRRAISLLTAMGYSLVTSCFSNPISRKLGVKLGFQEIARSYFDEMKESLEKERKKDPTAVPLTQGQLFHTEKYESELYAIATVRRLKQIHD
jgi:GNAT superfamily N-acetyltransferase